MKRRTMETIPYKKGRATKTRLLNGLKFFHDPESILILYTEYTNNRTKIVVNVIIILILKSGQDSNLFCNKGSHDSYF